MLLLIDNYDSFTYNLYQYIGELYPNIIVRRNNQIRVNEIKAIHPDYIVISPGPGHPEDAGISIDVIKHFSGIIPILGVCLGHQAIGLAMGGKIGLAKQVVHGKQSIIRHSGGILYRNIPSSFKAVRYHSLCVKKEGFPECLEIEACAADGTIMALRHKQHLTYGVQYHPESILTEYGKVLLRNFLEVKCNHLTVGIS